MKLIVDLGKIISFNHKISFIIFVIFINVINNNNYYYLLL